MMELNREWKAKDRKEFIKYIESFQNKEKQEWTKRIINTNLSLLALPTNQVKDFSKEILKGNYLSFLDLEIDNYYETIAIQGMIICQIKDFSLMKKYLDKYVLKIDNWAHCDLLSLKVKNKETEYWQLINEYIKSPLPFVRRTGLRILFNFINYDEYVEKIFSVLNKFSKETEYYVNMIVAWLFCEMFIKRRKETLKFLKSHQLNKFSINKGISKCRDSFRVSQADKDMLLKYRIR